MTAELEQLAKVLAQWLEPAEGFHAYLFGSRVRGDHRPDSDVDVRIFLKDCQPTHESAEWWTRQNETDFAAVKALLPGPLAIHREENDDANSHIRAAAKSPLIQIGRLIVVLTPPMPTPNPPERGFYWPHRQFVQFYHMCWRKIHLCHLSSFYRFTRGIIPWVVSLGSVLGPTHVHSKLRNFSSQCGEASLSKRHKR
jgi:predicted nucleotidyltransferase